MPLYTITTQRLVTSEVLLYATSESDARMRYLDAANSHLYHSELHGTDIISVVETSDDVLDDAKDILEELNKGKENK